MEYISEKVTDWNASKVALISPDGAPRRRSWMAGSVAEVEIRNNR